MSDQYLADRETATELHRLLCDHSARRCSWKHEMDHDSPEHPMWTQRTHLQWIVKAESLRARTDDIEGFIEALRMLTTSW